ncbi:MAG: SMP-30/gluconolactonase/LRE family protein, partial [Marmoricola sp.]|nr:SMP-30/gluconolactonase/LRE family protein [Marmoricola sp.]
LVHDLDADASDYHMVTGVREHDGDVWLGSLEEAAVAVLPGATA